jgi:hypothetical protein
VAVGRAGRAGVRRGVPLGAIAEEFGAEQGQEDLILRLVLRVPLEDGALVELDDQAPVVDERLADRQAEDFQAAVRFPEIEERILGAVDDAGRAIALARRRRSPEGTNATAPRVSAAVKSKRARRRIGYSF